MVAELSLVVKTLASSKGSDGYPTTIADDRTCSYCDKRGHTADRCPQNPHKDKKCNYCGKMGHIEANCWSKQGARPVRSVQSSS